MAVTNVTLVTALFDIGRPHWRHYHLPESMYLGWLKNTLVLNANIVVFTDTHFYERVQALVKEFGHPDRTHIIVKNSYVNLTAFEQLNGPLEDLMFSAAFKSKVSFQVPEMLQPLYNVMMFNKIEFIREAMTCSPFHRPDTYYWWVDAGGLREDVSNYSGVEWPSLEKMSAIPEGKCLFFSHHAAINIGNREDHSLSQMRYIQGTAFGGMPKDLLVIGDLVFQKVRECLAAGYIGSDEKVFDLIYLDRPELFHLEVSTWRMYFSMFR